MTLRDNIRMVATGQRDPMFEVSDTTGMSEMKYDNWDVDETMLFQLKN